MPATLVIVDVQRDFCSGGALAVPDAEAILPVVNGLIGEFTQVVATQDWHPPGHVSFASSHPGRRAFDSLALPSGPQTLWPDHCVQETFGAALHPALRLPPGTPIVRKGVHPDIDSYSGFFENDGSTRVGLHAVLESLGASEIVLVGLATDFCVLHTALDARRLGYATTVVESGCRGIDAHGSLAGAWRRMEQAGIRRR
jgi:nicotinamidase/pyrazinamidase